MASHKALEGRRIPATPEVPQSSHEIVCACGLAASGPSMDDALDQYLVHVDESALLDQKEGTQ